MPVKIPEVWHIYGSIKKSDGTPFTQGKPQAFDFYNNQEYYLGETGLDASGKFTITYSRSQFQRGDLTREKPEVILKVIDWQNKCIWQSSILKDVTPEYTYTIILSDGGPIPPEYWKISGVVKVNNIIVSSGFIRLIDHYINNEYQLDESPINSNGSYELTYTHEQFTHGNPSRTAPQVTFKIFDQNGILIGETELPVTPIQNFIYNVSITQSSVTYTLQGRVLNSEGSPVSGLLVKAIALTTTDNGFVEVQLGNTISGSKGNYKISYDPTDIPDWSPGVQIDIKVVAKEVDSGGVEYDVMNKPLLIYNAGNNQISDVTVNAAANTDESEFTEIVEKLDEAGYSRAAIVQVYNAPEKLELVVAKTGEDEQLIKDISNTYCLLDQLKIALEIKDSEPDPYNVKELPILITDSILYPFVRTSKIRDLNALKIIKPSEFSTVLVTAIVKKIVSPEIKGTLTAITAEWTRMFNYLNVKGSYGKTLAEAAGFTGDQLNAVISYIAANGENRDGLWADIENDPIFTEDDPKNELLHVVVEIFEFCDRFMPLFNSIILFRDSIPRIDDKPEISLVKLSDYVQLTLVQWSQIIANIVLAPDANWTWVDHVSGETEAEKKSNYARILYKKIRSLYPMTLFRKDIDAYGKSLGTPSPTEPEDYWVSVIAFLNDKDNSEFDFDISVVEDYFNDPINYELMEKLKKTQRLYKLNPDFSVVNILHINNYGSALEICRKDQDEFVAQFMDIEDGEIAAKATYDAAVHMASQSMMIMASYHDELGLGTESMPSVSSPSPSLSAALAFKGIDNVKREYGENVKRIGPRFAVLFGSQNRFACEHCQSVFSPSAYLVDMMEFIGDSMKKKLLNRRPDIAHTDLSCQNTKGLLPYIDLVNELLEDAVCKRRFYLLDNYVTIKNYLDQIVPEGSNTPPDAYQMIQAFEKRGFPLKRINTIQKENVKTGENETWYVLTDTWKYYVRDLGNISFNSTTINGFEVVPYPQTGKNEDGRLTTPENIHTAAYKLLTLQVYPFNLPFNLPNETIHRFLELKGTAWYTLRKIFTERNDVQSVFDTATNRLFFKMSPEQYGLINNEPGKNPDGSPNPGTLIHRQWGMVESGTFPIPDSPDSLTGKWNYVLRNCAILLDNAKITLEELLDLLTTATFNIGNTLHLAWQEEDKPGFVDPLSRFNADEAAEKLDYSRLWLTSTLEGNAGEEDIDKFFNTVPRFIRLKNHINLNTFELDRILVALARLDHGLPVVFPVDLNQLSVIFRLAEDFDTDPVHIVAWFKYLDYINLGRGPKCLLEELFIEGQIDKARIEKWKNLINNGAYGSDAFFYIGLKDGDEILEDLGGDIPVLMSGLGITWEDLSVIIMQEFNGGGQKSTTDPRLVLETVEFSLDSISRMFRVVSISKALGISIQEYYTIIKLMNYTHRNNGFSVQFPYQLRDAVLAYKKSGMTIAEIEEILTFKKNMDSEWAVTIEDTISILDAIQLKAQEKIASLPSHSDNEIKAIMGNTVIEALSQSGGISVPVTNLLCKDVLKDGSDDLLNNWCKGATGGWNRSYYKDIDFKNLINGYTPRIPAVELVSGSSNPNKVLPFLNGGEKSYQTLSAEWKTKLFSVKKIRKTFTVAYNAGLASARAGEVSLSIILNGTALHSAKQSKNVEIKNVELEAFTFYDIEIKWTAPDESFLCTNLNLKVTWENSADTTAGNNGEPATELLGPRNTTTVDNFNHLKFQKAARLLQVLKLGEKDVIYAAGTKTNVVFLDFNALPQQRTDRSMPWTDFAQFVNLADLITKVHMKDSEKSIVDLMTLASEPGKNETAFHADIVEMTGWDLALLEALDSEMSLTFPGSYRLPDTWFAILKAVQLVKKLGFSVLFCKTLASGDVSEAIAGNLRIAIRNTFSLSQWNTAVEPVQNQLRKLQRDALISYLFNARKPLVEDDSGADFVDLWMKVNHALDHLGELPENPKFDADFRVKIQKLEVLNGREPTGANRELTDDLWRLLDSREYFINRNALFAYFLIDTEMEPCMKTTRMVQAMSSVQLFIQRSILGLEDGIAPREKFKKQWSWMKNYRVWEANRKIFLYPENWLEPDLRDDKTPLFEELETALLQKELNKDTVEEAVRMYTDKLSEIADLEVVGAYEERVESETVLHIVGRTHHYPQTYFYRRRYDLYTGDCRWSPWEKIELEISADLVIPVILNRNLYIFWPQVEVKEKEGERVVKKDEGPKYQDSRTFAEVKLAWSVLSDGKWSPKRMTEETYFHVDTGISKTPESKPSDAFHFIAEQRSHEVVISVYATNPQFEKKIDILRNWYSDELRNFFGNWAYTLFHKKLNKVAEFTFGLRGNITLHKINDDSIDLETKIPDHTRLRHNAVYEYVNDATAKTLDFLIYPNGNTILERTPGDFRLYSTNMAFIDDSFKPLFFSDNQNSFIVNKRRTINRTIIKDAQQNETYLVNCTFKFDTFNHPHAFAFSERALYRGIDCLMTREAQASWGLSGGYEGGYLGYHIAGDEHVLHRANIEFTFKYLPTDKIVKPYPIPDVNFELSGAYGLYNWELFFHLPILIANRLMNDKKYDEAMRWFHYIFNPSSDFTTYEMSHRWMDSLSPGARFWNFLPFFGNRKVQESLEASVARPDDKDEDTPLGKLVEEWKEQPFKPHLIARRRIAAYQKYVVMSYLDNLINWADSLFRQDTMESVNEATQLYIIASEILGKRPVITKPQQELPGLTYAQLARQGLNSFSTVMIDLENYIPATPPEKITLWKRRQKPQRYYYYYFYSGQSTADAIPRESQPLLRMPSMVSYFCIPFNDKLMTYWDKVEDRLFKIRNCMNINGVKRTLALFAPPIEPGMLARAAASGLSIGDILRDMQNPLPPYRYRVLFQKAVELCNEVRSLGAQLLAAIEKKDGEELAKLRAQHELEIYSLIKDLKKRQIDEAKVSLDALKLGREVTDERYKYYANIKKLNDGEKIEQDLKKAATIIQVASQATMMGSSVLTFIPDFYVGALIGMAGGPTVDTKVTGGEKIGSALEKAGNAIRIAGEIMHTIAAQVGAEAALERRWEEWKHQEILAQKELRQIDKQIKGTELRIEIAELDLRNQEKQIEQSEKIKNVMETKFSNYKLYDWMKRETSNLHTAIYDLAYQMARKAEKAYQFELGDTSTNFIKPEYWDSSKNGLLAGDRLMSALQHMDSSYLENNRRELEITKSISLRLLEPEQLLSLRDNGSCTIKIPELLFDIDFQNHYFRRIKSVRITIPCITGPYTNVNAQLRLITNTIRISDEIGSNGYEQREPGDSDNRFVSDSYAKNYCLATSTANQDSGMFELNFKDDRYLPFEGAGVDSTWQLSLPNEIRMFDYNSITDVVLHVSYTARGSTNTFFEDAVKKNIRKKVNAVGNLPRIFSFKQEFAQAFHELKAGNAATIVLTEDMFPFARVQMYNSNAVSLVASSVKIVCEYNSEKLDNAKLIHATTPFSVNDNNATSVENFIIGESKKRFLYEYKFGSTEPIKALGIQNKFKHLPVPVGCQIVDVYLIMNYNLILREEP